uniref:Putative ovule protein n=1 Tax=Solanum chacoense TaxID=4108 RepID=A0A0V0GNX6_SOLCH
MGAAFCCDKHPSFRLQRFFFLTPPFAFWVSHYMPNQSVFLTSIFQFLEYLGLKDFSILFILEPLLNLYWIEKIQLIG